LGSTHQHEAGAVLAAIELDDIATDTSAAVIWPALERRRAALFATGPEEWMLREGFGTGNCGISEA